MSDIAHIHAKLLEGLALQQAGQFVQAQDTYRQVLMRDPQNFDALHLLGVIAAQTKNFADSVMLLDRAIAINPDNAAAHYNHGIALDELRRYDAAVAAYDKAIKLKPDNAVAYNNRGVALTLLRRYTDAIASFDYAIALHPGYADAYYNRGQARSDVGRLDDALADFDEALRLKPDYPSLPGIRLHTKLRLCDWHNVAEDIAAVENGINRGENVTTPWPTFAFTDSPAVQYRAAHIWACAAFPPNPILGNLAPHTRHEKIRIGYFSMDFRDHPVAQLTARLFELHNREKFEIYAFSYGPDVQDDMSRRLRGAFDVFIDVCEKSDEDVAALARDMRIDIAVDLAGYTTSARPGIMALRAAPVQVSYLGYTGSMAVPYIDYVIADRHVVPEVNREHFSEKIAALPCYFVNDDRRPISGRTFTREDAGLPPDGIVFCCFNATHKILPPTFACWMHILSRVNGSVLWLAHANPAAMDNLRREAAQHGIDPARLVFAERLPSTADHLARHRLADLSLDTLPFNAHTTASDALWAGVPHATCPGSSFAGRVGFSLLQALGLPELVASTPAEYETLVVALATQPDRLRLIKERLRKNIAASLPFDTARFARSLENVYTQMMERCDAGLPPDHIAAPL